MRLKLEKPDTAPNPETNPIDYRLWQDNIYGGNAFEEVASGAVVHAYCAAGALENMSDLLGQVCFRGRQDDDCIIESDEFKVILAMAKKKLAYAESELDKLDQHMHWLCTRGT